MKRMTTALLALSFLITVAAAPALAALQTTCPVMGGPINKELYADHNDKRVYFCCAYCDGEFKKNPEKYLNKLKEMDQEAEIIK